MSTVTDPPALDQRVTTTTKSNSSVDWRRLGIPEAVSLLVIVTTAIFWLASPEMRRPLELDELSTVERYTWAGVEPNGELRKIHRVADFHQLPTPGWRHVAIGVY